MGQLLAAMVEACTWLEFQPADSQKTGVGSILLDRVYDELDRTLNLGAKGILVGKLSESIKKSGKILGLDNTKITYLFDWRSNLLDDEELYEEKDLTLKIWGIAMQFLRDEFIALQG